MRITLFWLMTLLLSVSAFAQTPSAPPSLPNRAETITYLDKRLKEVVNLYYTGYGNNQGYFYKNTVYADGDGRISILRESGTLQSVPFTGACESSSLRLIDNFRPSQITDVKWVTGTGDVGFASIYLSSATAKKLSIWYGYSEAIAQGLSGYGSCTFWKERSRSTDMVSRVDFGFLTTDSTNFTKIRKALFHLRDLDKATDDPFRE